MLWKTNSYVKFSFLFVLIGQICKISISFDEGMKEDVADVLFKTHFLLEYTVFGIARLAIKVLLRMEPAITSLVFAL